MRSIGPSTFTGSITSALMNLYFRLDSRCAIFCGLPVMKLSPPTISSPCASNRSVKCEARKPAAPLIKTRMDKFLLINLIGQMPYAIERCDYVKAILRHEQPPDHRRLSVKTAIPLIGLQ